MRDRFFARITVLSMLVPLVIAAVIASVCASEEDHRLADGVTAAVAWNELTERWHAGVLIGGNQPVSFLSIFCITDGGKTTSDSLDDRVGINVTANPGDFEGVSGLDWKWEVDGAAWQGESWGVTTNRQPPAIVPPDVSVAEAFVLDVQDATTLSLIGSYQGEMRYRVEFDVMSLLSTPLNFVLEDCDAEAIGQRVGAIRQAYVYWVEASSSHAFSFTTYDDEDHWVLGLACIPKSYADELPEWVEEEQGGVVALATLRYIGDGIAASLLRDTADVRWLDDDGEAASGSWVVRKQRLTPSSSSENLRFIDAMRRSDELQITIESDTGSDDVAVSGSIFFTMPMGTELATCLREHADLNE